MNASESITSSNWRQRLFGSLLGQLRLAAFTSVFVGFTAASAATLLINQRALIRQHEYKVERSSETLADQLTLLETADSPPRREKARDELRRHSSVNLLYWIRLADGTYLVPDNLGEPMALPLASQAFSAQQRPGENVYSSVPAPLDGLQRRSGTRSMRPDSYRVVTTGERDYLTHLHLSSPGGSSLWVAEDISANIDFLSSLLSWMVVVWSICLALTLLAISLLTRRIIRPLRDLNQMAGSITSSSLATSRLEVDRAPMEVLELANGYNNLLDRLSLAWDHQREFVSSVSHELRNPLTIIGGYLRRVRRQASGLDPEQQRSLATAEGETHRITRLLDDLLDLSRSDSGRLQLVLRPVAVDEVLLTTCDLARSQLARPLELSLPASAGETPIEALAEADRLQQVVMNLIENADKYSPAGQPIRVTLRQESPGGLCISVTDRGIGIPPEDLPRIFERFHRGRNAAERMRGSGLGLSVVKLLVEAMGGTIDVQSQIDQGSSFHIRLPALRSFESVARGSQAGNAASGESSTAPCPSIS